MVRHEAARSARAAARSRPPRALVRPSCPLVSPAVRLLRPSVCCQWLANARRDLIWRHLSFDQAAHLCPGAVEKVIGDVHELRTSVELFILRVATGEVAAEQVPGEFHELHAGGRRSETAPRPRVRAPLR